MKKPYATPTLTLHGTVEKLTKAGLSFGRDFLFLTGIIG